LTCGLSPLALSQAYTDWAGHLLMSRDKQAELMRRALPQDTRFFSGEAWRLWPFNLLSRFLLSQQWWHGAATGVLARQALDAVSPKNFPLTNPEVFGQILKQSGMNFLHDALNFWEDWHRLPRVQSQWAPRRSRLETTSRSRPARSSFAIA
jgi:polyhydroxyalkanoate synthase